MDSSYRAAARIIAKRDRDVSSGLQLTRMRLRHLPSLLSTTGIKFLDLSGNQLSRLRHLPPLLRSLDVRLNHLRELPPLPTSLLWLNVSRNRLTSLPDDLSNLHFLDCSWNLLTSLPSLRNCFHLVCGHNRLRRLPNDLGQCIILYCGCNRLIRLPAMAPNCTVVCHGNQLRELGSVQHPLRAGFLNARDNCLRTIAHTVCTGYVGLTGNRFLTSIPAELFRDNLSTWILHLRPRCNPYVFVPRNLRQYVEDEYGQHPPPDTFATNCGFIIRRIQQRCRRKFFGKHIASTLLLLLRNASLVRLCRQYLVFGF